MKRLTTARIDGTSSRDHDIWLSDNDGSRGLGRLLIRIGRSGSRRFYYRYSSEGKQYVLPLGLYSRTKAEGHLTLEEARAIARHNGALRLVPNFPGLLITQGEQAARKTVLPSATRGTLATTILDLCWAYQGHVATHKSLDYANACSRDIKNYIAIGGWSMRQASEFTSEDAVSVLREICAHGGKDKANRIRSLLHAAFNFAMESTLNPNAHTEHVRIGIRSNPIKQVQKIKISTVRLERVLSGKELGLFWNHLTNTPFAHTAKYRLIRCSLLLGGQRCLQLLRAKTTDVDIDSRTLTLLDGKGRRDVPRVHLLPLTERALEEVLPMLEECRLKGWVHLFHARRDAPITDFTVSKAVFDVSSSLLSSGQIRSKFCYLDIRRTIETRMSDLRIPKEIRAQLQSHDLGGIQMVHYNRSHFLEQKREALDEWQKYLFEQAKQAASLKPMVEANRDAADA